MKKCDLHIHTISTLKDHPFMFSMDVLVDYVQKCAIEVIAITNHNTFDRMQYEEIRVALPDVVVMPGIEVDLDGGHVILIADNDGDSLDDFVIQCSQVTPLIKNQDDTIRFQDFSRIFSDFSKYLIIPHYEKDPALPLTTISKFGVYVSAGEVCSVKKFVSSIKNITALTPVLFSDIRIEESIRDNYPIRQTYLDIHDFTVNAFNTCLKDKAKVGLSPSDGHKLFECFSDGQCLSTGLNIMLGKRSSGKTYTLDRLAHIYGDKALYIRQFELLTLQAKNSLEQFEKEDRVRQELLSEEYLKPFKDVVEDIVKTPTRQMDMNALGQYVDSLLKYANEQHLSDIYSKSFLYNESKFTLYDLSELTKIIDSVLILLENVSYREMIDSHLDNTQLRLLFCDLVDDYRTKSKCNCIIKEVNSTIDDVKRSLQLKSVVTGLPDLDLPQLLLNSKKRNKFRQIATELKKSRIIEQTQIGNFTIQTSTRPYNNATDMNQGKKYRLAEAYPKYEDPLEFIKALKDIGVESNKYYLYFTKFEYRILNNLGQDVSGGEHTEFTFLQKVKDAKLYDILIIDEPESSFDNVFLRKQVNTLIKEISQLMPVVVSTHNSTIGGSIKPDYILYTDKQVENGAPVFRIYSGHPDDKELMTISGESIKNYNVTLDSLEAGEDAYKERKHSYEILEN